MDRQSALAALVRLDGSADTLARRLEQWLWDSEPLIKLTRQHVISALQRYQSGDLSALVLEAWANAIEGRDDIEFEDAKVGEAVHEIANPVLQGALTEVAPDVLRRLGA